MTIIIVEGLDRCGKSTQIKRVMKHFTDKPIQWLHYTSIKELNPPQQTEWFKKTFDHMFKLIQDDSSHWILDRSHLGEGVYGPLYRPKENTNYIFDLESKYRIGEKKDIYLIILYDSSFKNVERDDGDSYSTNLEIVQKEVDLFKTVYEKTCIQNKIIIDIAGKNEEVVENDIKEFLKV